MRSKLEDQLDKEFEQMNVKPWVYHIKHLDLFDGVTIVADSRHSTEDIAYIVHDLDGECDHGDYDIAAPATWLREQLVERGFYGVAICDWRDSFSRKRGRLIAKGRLLKYLKNGANQ